MMPNKTIYVSDGDLPVFERAQELAGGNLSAAIAAALRRYVEAEETREAGEIIVKVGSHGAYVQKRFQGRQVGKFCAPSPDHKDHSRMHMYRVYLTAKGNFAVYLKETPNWSRRNWSASENHIGDWWQPSSRLDVYATLDELRAHLPEQLFAAVAATVQHGDQGIEDLDI